MNTNFGYNNKMNQLIILISLFFSLHGCSEKVTPEAVQIIPVPSNVNFGSGTFCITKETPVYTNLQGNEKEQLLNLIRQSPLQLGKEGQSKDKKSIQLIITDETSDLITDGYRLQIKASGIKIEAKDGAGLFYGLQSLLQLSEQYGADKIPAMTIQDNPRLTYRGLMIDVSRHFFSKEFIMKQLDMMAYYKLNRLHWHLVDGAGWRIEIKKYPQLTEKAAWRPYEDLNEWSDKGRHYCTKETPDAYGGYYTQEDIREVVEYANRRYITIIPEIEMPGHSEEVLAVFPELSCSGKAYTNSDYCIGNPGTFVFLEDVLSEILDLFPSEYIHIGGDEAGKSGWRTCKKCHEWMKKEGLENVDNLQSYMIHRMEVFLNSHGRKLVGWDEIMEGGLAPNATVMSWRGVQAGITAAKSGHHVIMTPIQYLYFNFYQDAPQSQPLSWAGYTPLEKVYSFDPVPDSLTTQEKNYILGVQANLWTEYIPTEERAELMIWPRLLALAEIAWSQPERKSYPRFRENALKAIRFLQSKGYHPFSLEKEVGERSERLDTIHHLAYGKPVEYKYAHSPEYPANGSSTLTDGLQGGWSCDDKRWLGFISCDLDVVIDLQKEQSVHSINATFMQDSFAWIWMPEEAQIYTSINNKDYVLLATIKNSLPFNHVGFFLNNFGWKGETSARYIRYVAKPDKDNKKVGFIFTDEIIVQ